MSAQKVQQAMNLAVSHHQAGRFAEAEPIYRQVLATQPNNAEALHLLGVLNAQIGRHELAAELIQKAIAASPRNPTYLGNLGLSLLQLARFDQAATVYQQLIALQPGNASAHYFLGNVHFARGDLAAAIASYERSLALRPVNFDALHNLGNALVSNRQYEQAITVCRRAIQMNPNFAGTHNNLGNALKNIGKLDEAITSYRNAIVLDQNLAEAHNNLGNTLQEKKELDLAIAAYRRAIEINPKNADFFCNLGSALEAKNEPEEATAALNQSLALDPGFFRSHYNLGILSTAQDKLGQAITHYKRAIELKSDYFEAWLALGVAHVIEKHPGDAVACFEQAARLKPESVEAHNSLGLAFSELGQIDRAIANHERAIELKPAHLETMFNLAEALMKKGRLVRAKEILDRAMTLNPNSPDVYTQTGMLWRAQGDLDQAIACFQRSIEMKRDNMKAYENLWSTQKEKRLRQNVPKDELIKVLIRNHQSPGDLVMLTAAIRDLHLAYPNQFLTDVDTPCPGIFEHNPYLTKLDRDDKSVRVITGEYPMIHKSNTAPYHFVHGFAQNIADQLNIPRYEVTEFKGDITLSEEERSLPSQVEALGVKGPFWIVMAGGKTDFTAKWWDPDAYQEVVDYFKGKITFVQCGAVEQSHVHRPLNNVINLCGKTNIREYLLLMYHAVGVLCPITFAMHAAAAVPSKYGLKSRPCVVVAGGREPPQFIAYPYHRFLCTNGALDCCASGGCWKSRCQKVYDGDPKDNDLCVYPIKKKSGISIPKCMEMITARDVIKAIEMHYEEGGGVLKYDGSNPKSADAPESS